METLIKKFKKNSTVELVKRFGKLTGMDKEACQEVLRQRGHFNTDQDEENVESVAPIDDTQAEDVKVEQASEQIVVEQPATVVKQKSKSDKANKTRTSKVYTSKENPSITSSVRVYFESKEDKTRFVGTVTNIFLSHKNSSEICGVKLDNGSSVHKRTNTLTIYDESIQG
jgi:hypothetical protein